NHCQLYTAREAAPSHSHYRLQRLEQLLGKGGQDRYTLAQAQAALRDGYDLGRERVTPHPTMNTIRRVDNQISVVLRPALGELWVTPGPLIEGKSDQFYRLDVHQLLALTAAPEPPAQATRRVETILDSNGAVRPDSEPAQESGPIMSRFGLRMVDAPLDAAGEHKPTLQGPVLLLGDNATALALRRRLEEWGATVLSLPAGDDAEQTLAALEGHWNDQPAPHLFVLTARDEDAACGFEAEA